MVKHKKRKIVKRKIKQKIKSKVKKPKGPVRIEDIEFPDDYSLQEVGVSQSLMSQYQRCRRAFLLSLNRWTDPGKGKKTGFGSLFHEMLDKLYNYFDKTGKVPSRKLFKIWIEEFTSSEKTSVQLSGKRQREIERDKAVCLLLLCEYVKYYAERDFSSRKKFFWIEHTFAVKFKGFLLRGKRDGHFYTMRNGKRHRRWVMEHKTKSRFNMDELLKHLTFDFQNLFYITADEIESGEPVRGVLYNIVRNPQKRWTQDMTLSEFIKALEKDVQRKPSHYFIRMELLYTEKDKKTFKRDLFHKLSEADKVLKGKMPVYKNEHNCIGKWTCDYLNACSCGLLSGYKQKPVLFTELQP